MAASPLERLQKVGAGTYGIVYMAKQRVESPSLSAIDSTPASGSSLTTPTNRCLTAPSPDTEVPQLPASGSDALTRIVAVKRNLTDTTTSFIGNVRELDMLARLKGAPFVVDLVQVAFGDPFEKQNPMTPILCKRGRNQPHTKEDSIHFVMEYIPIPGSTFFPNKSVCTPEVGRLLACQLALGLEFIHARGVTHRDLKPDNILISLKPEEGPRLKLCDFGLSQILCRGMPSTPGVTTSWYRAPEVCAGSTSYGHEIDMWAYGCLLIDIFGKLPYMYPLDDNGSLLFNNLLTRHPTAPPRDLVEKMVRMSRQGTSPIQVNGGAWPSIRRSFIDRMEWSSEYRTTFQKAGLDEKQLTELLTNLLQFDPTARWTATQALDAPFFDPLRDYISQVRATFPPEAVRLPMVRILDCSERRWVIDIAFNLYNKRTSYSWYRHRIIFHAIDLFDRYLEWLSVRPERRVHQLETEYQGHYHTRTESEHRFYVCLYLMHKYYSTLSYPVEWKEFAPAAYTGEANDLVTSQFETTLVMEVCQYCVYRDSLLEMPEQYGHVIDEVLIFQMLLAYGQCKGWSKGSIRSFYRTITETKPR